MEFQLTLPIPAGEGIYCWDAASIANLPEVEFHKLRLVLEEFGKRSAHAQGLRAPITDIWRLRGSDQRAYLHLRQTPGRDGRLLLLGGLKVGGKRLFIRRDNGTIHEMEPCCVLDFYVHESCQRLGLGRGLFEHFLSTEGRAPHQLAYDRPSPKLLAFLRKHYGLSSYTPQNNNFVMFDAYFDPQQQQQRHIGNAASHSSNYHHQQQQEEDEARSSSSRPPSLWQQQQQAPAAAALPPGPLSSRRRSGGAYPGATLHQQQQQQQQQQQLVGGGGGSSGGSILGGATGSWQQQGGGRGRSGGSGGGAAGYSSNQAHLRDSLDSLLDGAPSTQQQQQDASAGMASTSSYDRQQQQQQQQHSQAGNAGHWEQQSLSQTRQQQQQQGMTGTRQWSAGLRPPYAVQDWVPAPLRTTTPSLGAGGTTSRSRRGAVEPGTMLWAGYTLTLPQPVTGAAGGQVGSSMAAKKVYMLPTEAMAGSLPPTARPASGVAGLYQTTLGGSEDGGCKAADASLQAWRTGEDAGTQQLDQQHLAWALDAASRGSSACGQASASRQAAYAQQRGHGAASCMRFYC